jgi:molybdopterin molybdotransferase
LASAWLAAAGYSDATVSHLRDDLDETTAALDVAMGSSDLVIVTGGVSVGDRDYVPEAARRAGASEVFWRVAQRPGKPLLCAVRDSTPVLGLPGNPGAVFVSLAVHVRRVLDLLEGVSAPRPLFSTGVLGFPVAKIESREQWARCTWHGADDGTVLLTALPKQASHMISNLAHCTALARIPAGHDELPAGSVVPWTPCGYDR